MKFSLTGELLSTNFWNLSDNDDNLSLTWSIFALVPTCSFFISSKSVFIDSKALAKSLILFNKTLNWTDSLEVEGCVIERLSIEFARAESDLDEFDLLDDSTRFIFAWAAAELVDFSFVVDALESK